MKTSTLLGFGLALTGPLTQAYVVKGDYSPGTSSKYLQKRQNATAPCVTTGVHMIVARASTEKPGQGIIGAVATQVQTQLPGSDSEAVDYPATLGNYSISEGMGVSAMTKLIESYVQRCPSSKIALLGYSQGAQVAGDVMCGTGESVGTFNSTPPLAAAFSKNVVAIIQMGDPTHVPNLSQDVGNSTKAGIFPRNNTASCASSAAITQSYCNADDRFCDSGSSIQVHLGYVQAFGSQAANFVVQKAGGNGTRKG